MQVARQAFQLLLAISRADGRITAHERQLLEHYRAALGLDDDFPDLDISCGPGAIDSRELNETAFHERVEVFKVMLRVAYADGVSCRRERKHLRTAAAVLGIKRVKVAALEWEVRRERVAARKQALIVAATVAVVIVGVALLFFSRPSEAALEETFRVALERGRPSILLVVVDYTLTKDGEKETRQATGTAFVVTDEGHLVTNRHVIEPWFGAGRARDLVEAGWELDPSSFEIAAWPAGSRLYATKSTLDRTTCLCTRERTLEVVAMAGAPSLEIRQAMRVSGSASEIDLALLRATRGTGLRPLPLARADVRVASPDRVLAVGFPLGLRSIDGWNAEVSAAGGEVRLVDGAISISAPVEHGNSGGPLFGSRGEVIGVVTSRRGSATMGSCLPVRHVFDLLEGVGLK